MMGGRKDAAFTSSDASLLWTAISPRRRCMTGISKLTIRFFISSPIQEKKRLDVGQRFLEVTRISRMDFVSGAKHGVVVLMVLYFLLFASTRTSISTDADVCAFDSTSTVVNNRSRLANTYKCRNAWQWHRWSLVSVGNLGYMAIKRYAMASFSVENVRAAPPRKRNPMAV